MGLHALTGLAVIGGSVVAATTIGLALVQLIERAFRRPRPSQTTSVSLDPDLD